MYCASPKLFLLLPRSPADSAYCSRLTPDSYVDTPFCVLTQIYSTSLAKQITNYTLLIITRSSVRFTYFIATLHPDTTLLRDSPSVQVGVTSAAGEKTARFDYWLQDGNDLIESLSSVSALRPPPSLYCHLPVLDRSLSNVSLRLRTNYVTFRLCATYCLMFNYILLNPPYLFDLCLLSLFIVTSSYSIYCLYE